MIGDFGDPLADIFDWMLPPYPAWLAKEIREGKYKKGVSDVYFEER